MSIEGLTLRIMQCGSDKSSLDDRVRGDGFVLDSLLSPAPSSEEDGRDTGCCFVPVRSRTVVSPTMALASSHSRASRSANEPRFAVADEAGACTSGVSPVPHAACTTEALVSSGLSSTPLLTYSSITGWLLRKSDLNSRTRPFGRFAWWTRWRWEWAGGGG